MSAIPLAIYDSSSPKKGDYWQFVSPGLAPQLADLHHAWFDGFPEPILGEYPTEPVFTWSLGGIHDGKNLWLYRKYWAGRELEARPGRHFYILLRLDSPKQATDLAIERFLKAFEGEQPLPLDTRTSLLTQDCLCLEGQGHHPALITFEEKFLVGLNKQHVGAEFEANGKQINQFSKELQDARKQSKQGKKPSQTSHTRTPLNPMPSQDSFLSLRIINLTFLVIIIIGCVAHYYDYHKTNEELDRLRKTIADLTSEIDNLKQKVN